MWHAINHSMCKTNICLWSTCPTLYGFLYICTFLLYIRNLYMYICICLLSIVDTGVLTCPVIVLYSLYWIKGGGRGWCKTTKIHQSLYVDCILWIAKPFSFFKHIACMQLVCGCGYVNMCVVLIVVLLICGCIYLYIFILFYFLISRMCCYVDV